MITLSNATPEDVKNILGESTYFTLYRARVAKTEAKVLGLWGIVHHQGRKYLFSEIHPDGFKYPKQILKTARSYLKELPQGVYYAVADSRYTKACAFLVRLGFKKEIDLYRLEIK